MLLTFTRYALPIPKCRYCSNRLTVSPAGAESSGTDVRISLPVAGSLIFMIQYPAISLYEILNCRVIFFSSTSSVVVKVWFGLLSKGMTCVLIYNPNFDNADAGGSGCIVPFGVLFVAFFRVLVFTVVVDISTVIIC